MALQSNEFLFLINHVESLARDFINDLLVDFHIYFPLIFDFAWQVHSIPPYSVSWCATISFCKAVFHFQLPESMKMIKNCKLFCVKTVVIVDGDVFCERASHNTRKWHNCVCDCNCLLSLNSWTITIWRRCFVWRISYKAFLISCFKSTKYIFLRHRRSIVTTFSTKYCCYVHIPCH